VLNAPPVQRGGNPVEDWFTHIREFSRFSVPGRFSTLRLTRLIRQTILSELATTFSALLGAVRRET
jgi:hypothetical protein